jgi:hypothetical protein
VLVLPVPLEEVDGPLGREKLAPLLSLGCGTFGGDSTTDNVTYTNLLNVKRLAAQPGVTNPES